MSTSEGKKGVHYDARREPADTNAFSSRVTTGTRSTTPRSSLKGTPTDPEERATYDDGPPNPIVLDDFENHYQRVRNVPVADWRREHGSASPRRPP